VSVCVLRLQIHGIIKVLGQVVSHSVISLEACEILASIKRLELVIVFSERSVREFKSL